MAIAIATFEIYGWKFTGYLILIRSFSSCQQNVSKAYGSHVYGKLITWSTNAKGLLFGVIVRIKIIPAIVHGSCFHYTSALARQLCCANNVLACQALRQYCFHDMINLVARTYFWGDLGDQGNLSYYNFMKTVLYSNYFHLQQWFLQ